MPRITQDDLGREGLRVILEPIPGLSKKGILDVDGLFFQCPPLEEFPRDYAHSHTDYDTVHGGQFSRKAARQLRTVTFDTLVVDWGLYTIVTARVLSDEVTDTLVQICESGDPFLLTASHTIPPGGYDNWSRVVIGPEIQMAATLRTLKVVEKAGEGDARYMNLAFTEYRDPIVARRGLGSGGGGWQFPTVVHMFKDGTAKDARGIQIANPPLVPVSLANLSRHFYRTPDLAELIANKNGINWGRNDALIMMPRYHDMKVTKKQPYKKITIPRPPLSTKKPRSTGGKPQQSSPVSKLAPGSV